jgi:hypothetical protein
MPDIGTVLDSPDEDVLEDQQIAEEVVPDEADEVVAEPVAEVAEGDWRKVPPALKEFFKTPEGKAAKDAWFERNAYKDKFPDGMKQVEAITSFLSENGGQEGIAAALGELRGKAEQLDGIMAKMESGDASLVNDLTPETISKLAPAVVEQWAQSDPEGWRASMSGVMAATIAQNGIPMFLERMSMALEYGKTDQIPQMLDQLKAWAGGFATTAAAPRTQQAAAAGEKPFDAKVERQNWESEKFRTDVRETAAKQRDTLIEKELESFFKRRPNDAGAKSIALSEVRREVQTRMSADTKYIADINALLGRKDKDGAMRLITSREQAVIASIAPGVGRSIFGNPGPVAMANKAAAAGGKPEAGYAMTDKPPKPESIDRTLTTDAMIMRGKFILKDGRKLALEA